MRVQVENGAILEFPDDADEAEIDAGVNEFLAEQPAPPVQPQAPQSIGRTALEGVLSGATFGFSKDIVKPLGATLSVLASDPGALFTGNVDPSLSEELANLDETTKMRMQQQFEQNPGTSIASNVVGALLTGGAGASTKIGAALGNSIRAGGLAARVGKGALAGAASGGLYGAGTADEGQRMEGAQSGALLGGAFGGAIPLAGAAIGGLTKGAKTAVTGAMARGAEELDSALAGIKQQANSAYQAMREAGVVFSKPAAQNIMNSLETALKQSGPLNKRIHGNTIAVVKDLKDLAAKGKLGLEELEQYRQIFGDMAGDIGNKSNARTAAIVRSAIDNTLEGLDDAAFTSGGKGAIDALKLGRQEYARSRKFELISNILKKSEGDANYVKRELTKIANNPKKFRFSTDEAEALKQAARLSGGEAVLKIVGKFGFDPARLGSGVGAIFGGTGGAILGGASGAAAVPAIGTAARYGQKLLTRGKSENLLRTIEGAAASSGGGRAVSPLLSAPAGAAGGVWGGRSAASELPQVEPPVINRSQMQPDLAPQASAPIDYIQKVAQVESGGDPFAQAKTSSAKGLYQFTQGTWDDLVKKHGEELGVSRKDIFDPAAQQKMMEVFTADNAKTLTAMLGREPSDGELYIAHFLGKEGANKLLNAPTHELAARVLPAAAKANKNIFFKLEGNKQVPRTIQEVYDLLSAKLT